MGRIERKRARLLRKTGQEAPALGVQGVGFRFGFGRNPADAGSFTVRIQKVCAHKV